MNIIETIAKAKYLAKPEQVAQLALAYNSANDSRSNTQATYLRVLVASLCHELKIDRKHARLPDIDAQLLALEAVSDRFYPSIVEAVIPVALQAVPGEPAGIARNKALQRNSRTNFARSSKSTLVSFVKAGGNIRTLDVATMSKHDMVAQTHELNAERSGKPVATAQPSISRFVAQVRVLAESDRKAALALVESARDSLTECVNDFRAGVKSNGHDVGKRPWNERRQAA